MPERRACLLLIFGQQDRSPVTWTLLRRAVLVLMLVLVQLLIHLPSTQVDFLHLLKKQRVGYREEDWGNSKLPRGWPDSEKGKNMSSSAGDTVPSRGARILFLVRGHAITLQAPQRTTSDTLPNLLFFDSKRPLRISIYHVRRLADWHCSSPAWSPLFI